MVQKKVITGTVILVLIAIGVGVGLGVNWSGDEKSASPTYPTYPIVGESRAVRITKEQMAKEDGGSVRSRLAYTILEPGSSYIAVHFSSFDFARECSMELTDGEGILVVIYKNRGRRDQGNFWARHVQGDTLNILVYCVLAAGDNRADFEIDQIVRGIPDKDLNLTEPDQRQATEARNLRVDQLFPFDSNLHPSRQLSLCGGDDGKNAVCYRNSHPAEYNLGKAVARLNIAGTGVCTGWLVGPNDYLLTNFHCIASIEDVRNTDFQFMAEGANCNDPKTSTAGYEVYEGIELTASNYYKDYALIKMNGNPTAKYGYFEIDDRKGTPGEPIYIPGHPQRRAKQFALEDTYVSSGASNGRCAILDTGKDNCGYSTAYDAIGYTCDTLGGNSGSPVVAVNTMKVIGLHHCAALSCDTGNLAIPFEGGGIYSEIKSFVEGSQSPPPTSSPTTHPPTAAPKTPSPTASHAPAAVANVTPAPTQNPTVEGTLRCFAPKMRIEIQLDNFAGETRWELWQSDPPRIISQGSNYENNALIQEEHCLADDGLHYLKFFDEFGDGFCCGKGFGYYKVYYNEWLIYHNNGETGRETTMEIAPSQVCIDVPFHLTLTTDLFGHETTWDMKDSAGNVVALGGPYPGQTRLIEEQICVGDNGEISFTVYDSFGDGMCCFGGEGGFKLSRNGEPKIDGNGRFKDFVRYAVPVFGEGRIIEGGNKD